jgi:hypothetical protein
MPEGPVPIPPRFRRQIVRLGTLASAAEVDPVGPPKTELIEHLAEIRTCLDDSDPPAFRSVILRESSLAILLGASTLSELSESQEMLKESVNLGPDGGPIHFATIADLATAQIVRAIAANDRSALLGAIAHGDDSDQSPMLLAQTGLALSLLPLIAPDIMATSLGTPEQFSSAVPGWENRVVAHGNEPHDQFLLSLASARLHVLRALNTSEAESPTPTARLSEAMLLLERFAPADTHGLSRWAGNAQFAVLALGTICTTSIASLASLRRTSSAHRAPSDEIIRVFAAGRIVSVPDLCDVTAALRTSLSELTGASAAGFNPRYASSPFEDLLRQSSDIDSVVGAARVVGREIRLLVDAVQAGDS